MSPLPSSGDNPALARFGNAVKLYVGFDGHALAEIAPGTPTPEGNAEWRAAVDAQALAFEPGVYGEGLASRTYRLTYLGTGSVLRATGSLALWLKPTQLAHAGTYFWPVMLHTLKGGYQVMMGRMGDPRNRESLYAHLRHHGSGVSKVMSSMAGWDPGEWHLLVTTWDRGRVAFSVDGRMPAYAALKVPLMGDEAGGFRATLLCPSDDTFVYDEFLVLSLPLTGAEIKWLWEDGRKRQE